MKEWPRSGPGGRMYESPQDAVWVHSIDLAQEADFDLGCLRVRPATCEVELAGASQTLQRRVMQVLVALAQARGAVVSQNDLVNLCWRGLSVTDDAIYRCISQLRKLAAGYPEPPYAIEAIPGVGYRLTSPDFAQGGPAQDDHFQSIMDPDSAPLLSQRPSSCSSWRVRHIGRSTASDLDIHTFALRFSRSKH